MDIGQAKKISKVLTKSGIEHELREEYTGRGMGDKTTAAIVADKHTDRAHPKLFAGLSRDAMGKGCVWY